MKKLLTLRSAMLLLIIACTCFFVTTARAQGPGGLETDLFDLRLWLIADSIPDVVPSGGPVAFWPDESGNGNHAEQDSVAFQPELLRNQWNGRAIVNFTGDDFLAGALNAFGDSTTMIVVARYEDSIQSSRAFIMTLGDGTLGNTVSIGRDGGNPVYIDRFVNQIAPDSSLHGAVQVGNEPMLVHYSVNTNADDDLLVNNSTDEVDSSDNISPSGEYIIGAWADTTSLLDGEVAEIIVIDGGLNKSQRSVVANYLASKYDLDVSRLHYDNTLIDIGLHHQVMGLEHNSMDSVASVRSGGLLIADASLLADTTLDPFLKDANDYMYVGHNNLPGAVVDSMNTPDTVQMRLNQMWGVNFYNDRSNNGYIEMRFYLNEVLGANLDFTNAEGADYQLMSSAHLTPARFRLDQNVVQRTVNKAEEYISFILPVDELYNGGAYTIGTVDTINSPVPVELAEFSAQYEKEYDRVALDWATASEEQNAKFVIQRSQDGRQFESIGETVGSGTTVEEVKYTWYDREPLSGTSYYRLKQVDYDGDYEYSPIAVVNVAKDLEVVQATPNPFRSNVRLTVKSDKTSTAHLTLMDQVGRVVDQQQVQLNRGTNEVRLDMSPYQSGWYMVKFQDGQSATVMKLIKQ